MVYGKGNRMIAIEMHDLLGGKKPGLYVGEGNRLLKVGTFSSKRKAIAFQQMLEIMFGDLLVNYNNGVCRNDGQGV